MRRLLYSLLAVVLLLLALAGALVLWLEHAPAELDGYAKGAPQDWSYLRRWQKQHPKARARSSYLPLSRIPVELQVAVVSGEDTGFLGHGAWDLEAMREAYEEWRAGGKLRGASTLTQQLAKNLFLSGERSAWRKLGEARLAWWLHEKLGKRRILELYLNVVELGDGVFGAEAGAQLYFGKSATDLSADEAAQLAAAVPSPLKHNPKTRTGAWRVRYHAIAERMARYPWLRDGLLALQGIRPARPAAAAPAEATAEDEARVRARLREVIATEEAAEAAETDETATAAPARPPDEASATPPPPPAPSEHEAPVPEDVGAPPVTPPPSTPPPEASSPPAAPAAPAAGPSPDPP